MSVLRFRVGRVGAKEGLFKLGLSFYRGLCFHLELLDHMYLCGALNLPCRMCRKSRAPEKYVMPG